ncbi:MAG: hypothetical protein ACK5HL_04335 [Bacilli bacterium]
MSKIIQGLIGKKCTIQSHEIFQFNGNTMIEGTILETDEEWLKISYVDKRGKEKNAIIRIECVDNIQIINVPIAND